MLPALALTILAAQSPADAALCRTDNDGFCAERSVQTDLRYDAAPENLKINVALGRVLVIELPNQVALDGAPVLGNRALFEAQVDDAAHRLLVWPKLPSGAKVGTSALFGRTTNLQVFFDANVSLTLTLKIGSDEAAVDRLSVTFPEREAESAYVEEKLREQSARCAGRISALREAQTEQIQKDIRRALGQSLLTRMHCREPFRVRDQQALLILTVERICQLGDHVIVTFELKNRARDLFALDAVEVKKTEGGPIESTAVFAGDTTLPFDTRVTGAVVFEVPRSGSEKSYQLRVTEDAGKKRTVGADVEF